MPWLNGKFIDAATNRKRSLRFYNHTREKKSVGIPDIEVGLLQNRKKLEYLCNMLEVEGKIPTQQILDRCFVLIPGPAKRKFFNRIVSLQKAKKIPSIVSTREIKSICPKEVYDRVFLTEKAGSTLLGHILTELNAIRRKQAAPVCDDVLETRLDKICTLFDIDASGREVLLFLYLYKTDAFVDAIFETICEYMNVKTLIYPTPLIRPICVFTGLPRFDIAEALGNSSPLVRSGLLDKDRDMAAELICYLEGYGHGSLLARYFTEYTGDSIPIENHSLDKSHLHAITTLIANKPESRGMNILLYGEPGTGKTEFCRSLGGYLGRSVYEINNIDEEETRPENRVPFRRRALLACERNVDPLKSIIVVDEADEMLNTETIFMLTSSEVDKGQINKLLDDSKALIFWITNGYQFIRESTMRRFDYSVLFEALDSTQRQRIWNSNLRKHGIAALFSDEELEKFASDYEISAGGIDIAVRNAAEMIKKGENKENVLSVSREILNAHRKILDYGEVRRDERKMNASAYTLDGLAIKTDIKETIVLVEKFNEYWKKNPDEMTIRNMNMLLYGPPGTGKTEFARFIARHTRRRLIIKRASDILSCYIGETEKNIKKIFSRAEKNKAILLIDEADGLFMKRDHANQSWQITQVNELLANMEEFKGMLICATNFKEFLDSAAIRRFNIKLEFVYLRPDGNMEFYRRYLAPLIEIELSDPEIMELRSISALTPGDFKIVYQQNAFFEKSELSHQRLILSLKQEALAKNEQSIKKMGF